MIARSRTPEDLLSILEPLCDRFEITRVANVTGLDVLGIPTVMVYRPNARLADVSQGKGITLAEAKISGILEAIECWHAENPRLALWLATIDEARCIGQGRVIDPDQLPHISGRATADLDRLLWCRGKELISGSGVLLPFDLVNGDLCDSRPYTDGMFPFETTGLGAGNNLTEAIVTGIYEVIERDAVSHFNGLTQPARMAALVDVRQTHSPILVDLLARLEGKATATFWRAPTDVGVPVVVCSIQDPSVSIEPVPAAEGYAAAASYTGAAIRALLEAAQARLTHVCGAREDRFRSLYDMQLYGSTALQSVGSRLPAENARFPNLEAELDWLKGNLRDAGFNEIVSVKLSASNLPIVVVKVVIPGLEASGDHEANQVAVLNPRRVARLSGEPA